MRPQIELNDTTVHACFVTQNLIKARHGPLCKVHKPEEAPRLATSPNDKATPVRCALLNDEGRSFVVHFCFEGPCWERRICFEPIHNWKEAKLALLLMNAFTR